MENIAEKVDNMTLRELGKRYADFAVASVDYALKVGGSPFKLAKKGIKKIYNSNPVIYFREKTVPRIKYGAKVGVFTTLLAATIASYANKDIGSIISDYVVPDGVAVVKKGDTPAKIAIRTGTYTKDVTVRMNIGNTVHVKNTLDTFLKHPIKNSENIIAGTGYSIYNFNQ